jgi:hypothetical protein
MAGIPLHSWRSLDDDSLPQKTRETQAVSLTSIVQAVEVWLLIVVESVF